MGDVIDIKEYLSSVPDDNELKIALLKSLDAMPVELCDAERQEVYQYAKGLWTQVKKMEADSLKSFTLEIPCTAEQRELLNTQLNECIHFLINPRTKMINNLVAELIVGKIKEIQVRQLLME